MTALHQITQWPVPTAAAAYIGPDDEARSEGDTSHSFRLASISKMFVGWCALIAVEEGIVTLDELIAKLAPLMRAFLAQPAA